MKIGILHPGDMGSSVGYSCKQAGHQVFWIPAGRSKKSLDRARQAALTPLDSLEAMTSQCHLIISVCPPEFAAQIASEVAATSFEGHFLDANAISPQASLALAELFEASGATYLDGGLVGAPAWNANTTSLYLSGPQSGALANQLSGGTLSVKDMGTRIGQASAMKMCYAAYTKGQKALVATILGTAEHFQISDWLFDSWGEETSQKRVEELQRIAGRAWRWEYEMLQIADTLRSAGMPDGSHLAAAEIYARLSGFKDLDNPPDWQALLDALTKTHQD